MARCKTKRLQRNRRTLGSESNFHSTRKEPMSITKSISCSKLPKYRGQACIYRTPSHMPATINDFQRLTSSHEPRAFSAHCSWANVLTDCLFSHGSPLAIQSCDFPLITWLPKDRVHHSVPAHGRPPPFHGESFKVAFSSMAIAACHAVL